MNNEAGPDGVISQPISDEAARSTQMGNQINVMQATLWTQQQALQTEYANLE